MVDIVKVYRLIEYTGPRDWVEKTIKDSIHGTKIIHNDKFIRVTTLSEFPEKVENHD